MLARDQARGRLGRNSRPRGRNFALNGTQGEVGVALKKKKKKIFFFFFFFFFFRETHPHNSSCGDILPLHHFPPSLTGNSMCNG